MSTRRHQPPKILRRFTERMAAQNELRTAGERRHEILWLVLYGILGTIKLIFLDQTGDGGNEVQHIFEPLILGTLADCLAQLCLLWFVFAYFRRRNIYSENFLGILAGAVLGFLLVLYMAVDNTYIAGTQALLAQCLRYLALAVATILAMQNLVYLAVTRTSKVRLIAHGVLLGCLIISLFVFTDAWQAQLTASARWHDYLYEAALLGIFAVIISYEVFQGHKQKIS